jgi:hypothetical protein
MSAISFRRHGKAGMVGAKQLCRFFRSNYVQRELWSAALGKDAQYPCRAD